MTICPQGHLYQVWQMLQHPSNGESKVVPPKLSSYKYVLITDHYPTPGRWVLPNRDKPHGTDARVVDGSAVFLDQPLVASPVREVLRVGADTFQIATVFVRPQLRKQHTGC